jgi:ABC-type lipoprotein release transport system permease subunit
MPLLGRNFTADEDRPNAPRVALISYGLWRSRFGRDPSIINRTISIDGNPVRVIGVLGKDFELPTLDASDVLIPEGIDPASQRTTNPGRVRWAFARLKPGITIQQATAAMEPLFQQMLQTVPPQFRKEVHLRIRSLRDRQVHDATLAAWILLVAVISVLLIACANVGGLLLARAAGRQREMAVRSALGASRARLVRQTLTESLLLALIATTVGCIIAAVLIRIFVAVAPEGIPFLANAHLDLRVIVFAILASLLCGILFGIAPALQPPSAESLAGRSNLAVPHSKLRQILVMAQIAVSLVLLAGAGLLLRSLWNLQPEQQMAFFLQLESRLRKLPGVNAVALSDSLPPGGWRHDQIYAGIRVEGKPLPQGTGGVIVWRWVTPGYFGSLGIPIVQGRAFREDDRNSSEHFIIVSQSLARRMFPGEDPIGRHLQPGLEGPWYTIVGVAADVKNGGLTGESEPEYYRLRRNRAEDWQHAARVTVQTALAPATMEQWIRSEVASLDPTLPVETETMTQRVSKLADRPRFEAALLGLFASIGVLLAAMGIYGVIAFLVAQRSHEIGVRMALGATRRDILQLFGVQGLRMIAVGGAIGVFLAIAGLRALSSLLFGVRAADPLSFVIVCLLLTSVAALAIWIPARRATQVEPMEALRYE